MLMFLVLRPFPICWDNVIEMALLLDLNNMCLISHVSASPTLPLNDTAANMLLAGVIHCKSIRFDQEDEPPGQTDKFI